MLKTLDEHNKIARELLPIPNGIKCPECDKQGNISELEDDPHAPILMTYPCQIKIDCRVCEFTSYRVTWR